MRRPRPGGVACSGVPPRVGAKRFGNLAPGASGATGGFAGSVRPAIRRTARRSATNPSRFRRWSAAARTSGWREVAHGQAGRAARPLRGGGQGVSGMEQGSQEELANGSGSAEPTQAGLCRQDLGRDHARSGRTIQVGPGGDAQQATVDRHLALLRHLYNRRIDVFGYAGRNPIRKRVLFVEENQSIRWLTEEDEAALFAVVPEPYRSLCKVALYTGARRRELLGWVGPGGPQAGGC